MPSPTSAEVLTDLAHAYAAADKAAAKLPLLIVLGAAIGVYNYHGSAWEYATTAAVTVLALLAVIPFYRAEKKEIAAHLLSLREKPLSQIDPVELARSKASGLALAPRLYRKTYWITVAGAVAASYLGSAAVGL